MKDKKFALGISFAILFFGASFLIEAISYFSQSSGISPTILGLTFLNFGTSAIIISMMIAKSNNLF